MELFLGERRWAHPSYQCLATGSPCRPCARTVTAPAGHREAVTAQCHAVMTSARAAIDDLR